MLFAMRTLITGGIKSGKSSRALLLAESFATPRYFLATAIPFDDEMQERIRLHRQEREDRFITIEEPIEIHTKLRNNMILDCIPMWLNNLLYYNKTDQIDSLLNALIEYLPENIVIVTNEIGWGIIPDNPLARQYETLLGKINIRLAACCDAVELMVAGIPVKIK